MGSQYGRPIRTTRGWQCRDGCACSLVSTLHMVTHTRVVAVLLIEYAILPLLQALVRIPETLVCAMEFIIMPTPAEQTAAIDELRESISDSTVRQTLWPAPAGQACSALLLLNQVKLPFAMFSRQVHTPCAS